MTSNPKHDAWLDQKLSKKSHFHQFYKEINLISEKSHYNDLYSAQSHNYFDRPANYYITSNLYNPSLKSSVVNIHIMNDKVERGKKDVKKETKKNNWFIDAMLGLVCCVDRQSDSNMKH